MSLLSKKDKKTWENYIHNLKSFSIRFESQIDLVNKSKIKLSKKSLSSTTIKPIRKMKIKPDKVLDLHGYRLQTAKIILQKYILNSYEKNIRNILVITGKGNNNTGVLKKEVPLWLNDKIFLNLLINYNTAPEKFGGEGALLLRIKNKYKNLN